MRIHIKWSSAALAAALLTAGPVTARVVDYSVADALIQQEGHELKIKPIADGLTRSDRSITLSTAPDVDHITMALGMYCSAYKVENPIATLLKRLAADRSANSDTAAQSRSMNIVVSSARSYRRCVEIGEMNVRCIIRVALTGTVTSPDSDGALPINADIERDSSVSGICGSLARGIRVVSREAAIHLIKDAEAKLAESKTPLSAAD